MSRFFGALFTGLLFYSIHLNSLNRETTRIVSECAKDKQTVVHGVTLSCDAISIHDTDGFNLYNSLKK